MKAPSVLLGLACLLLAVICVELDAIRRGQFKPATAAELRQAFHSGSPLPEDVLGRALLIDSPGTLSVEGDVSIRDADPVRVEISNSVPIDVGVTSLVPLGVKVENALPLDVEVKNPKPIDVQIRDR